MKSTNRRQILGTLSTLPFLGIASQAQRDKVPKAQSRSMPLRLCACTDSDRQEYARLKTLDLDDPKENRRYMEMYEEESSNHTEYHDNMFCHDHEQTIAFMQDVKVPWMAFKVLAAGAIPPGDGFDFAFDSGADFICAGMFDFQLNFCKMEIRHTLKRKNLLSYFSFSNINYLIDNYLARLFKEIKKRISLNNMCLISILQNSCFKWNWMRNLPAGP
jgi:hypothetical protein